LRSFLLQSTDGNDVIYGFDFADTIIGGLGNDTLNGGEGADSYYYTFGDGADIISDVDIGVPSEQDRLILGAGIVPDDVILTRPTSDLDDLTLIFADGGSIVLNEQFASTAPYGVERIEFADGTIWTEAGMASALLDQSEVSVPLSIAGFSSNDTIHGGLASDILRGQGGNDTMHGGTGGDTVYGGDGNDVLYGDDGDDILNGDDGDDARYGGAGDYYIYANVGVDTFDGDSGVDTLNFTYTSSNVSMNLALGTATFENNDVGPILNFEDLIAGAGSNAIVGTDGDNVLDGGAGNDAISGGDGDDILKGGDGNDTLNGGNGDDLLQGGNGTDTLLGATGREVLTGGAAADTFVFALGDSGITAGSADTVTDWATADRIDTPVAGAASNYQEFATTATTIEGAAAHTESQVTNTAVRHAFAYNSSIDVGFLLSDLDDDDSFETGIILSGAGAAANFAYGNLI
jgi:Ca2+-binding RTX toxin-like protein